MLQAKRIIIPVTCFLAFLVCGLIWASADRVELTGAQRLAIFVALGLFASIGLFYYLRQRVALKESRHSLQQSDLSREKFKVTISHEVRTPLSGIVGVMRLLKRTQLDRNQRRYVDMAANSADMLLEIINDSLSQSRMDTAFVSIEAEKLVLAEVIEDATSILAPEAINKGLELVCDIDPDIPHRIKGDAIRLRQVLNNLLSNAIRYTETGDITIYAVRKDDRIEIGVKDTGIGIDARQREVLLRPCQKDGNFGQQVDWPGLGLKSSRRLIKAMGSLLQIESSPGVGSRFYFELAIDAGLGATYDWKPPRALQEMSVAILSPLKSQRDSIRKMLTHWNISRIQQVEFDADRRRDLPKLDPCDLLIIDQSESEEAVNDLIERLRNNSEWREARFVHLVPLNWQNGGGSADIRLHKPLSHSRLYTTLLDIVYKLAFSAEHGSEQFEAAGASPGMLAGHRILLVEDDDISKMITLEMLEGTGLDVDVANNGADAIEQVQQQQYDLILMDIKMPIMNGYEATRAIRALGGYFESIPIIAITAHALEGDSSKSLDAGMNYYISKPFEPDYLVLTIGRFIGKQGPSTDPGPIDLVLQ